MAPFFPLRLLVAWGRLLTARGAAGRRCRRRVLALRARLARCHETGELARVLAATFASGAGAPTAGAPPTLATAARLVLAAALASARRTVVLLERELAQAGRDVLTGVAGRYLVERRLREAVAASRRLGAAPPSLLLFDLDRLGAINRDRGRGVGDAALALVGRVLREVVGGRGHLGRWGGDEFAVVLPGEVPPDAVATALVAGVRAAGRRADLPVTVSVGWGTLQDDETASALRRRVDAACYRAKEAGRDRAVPAGVQAPVPRPVSRAAPRALPQVLPRSPHATAGASRRLLIRALRNRLVARRQRARARRALRRAGSLDVGSGCWQRWYGRARLAESCEAGGPAAVARLDLDAFKRRNDTGGHDAGDRSLRRVARLLEAELRDEDLLCRWDGSGFLLLLPGADATLAENVAARLRRHLAAADAGGETFSVGIADLRPGDGPEAVIARANAALDRARTDGGDRAVTDP